jgi:hypothetical protein
MLHFIGSLRLHLRSTLLCALSIFCAGPRIKRIVLGFRLRHSRRSNTWGLRSIKEEHDSSDWGEWRAALADYISDLQQESNDGRVKCITTPLSDLSGLRITARLTLALAEIDSTSSSFFISVTSPPFFLKCGSLSGHFFLVSCVRLHCVSSVFPRHR